MLRLSLLQRIVIGNRLNFAWLTSYFCISFLFILNWKGKRRRRWWWARLSLPDAWLRKRKEKTIDGEISSWVVFSFCFSSIWCVWTLAQEKITNWKGRKRRYEKQRNLDRWDLVFLVFYYLLLSSYLSVNLQVEPNVPVKKEEEKRNQTTNPCWCTTRKNIGTNCASACGVESSLISSSSFWSTVSILSLQPDTFDPGLNSR